MLYISKTKRLAFDLETALQLDDANADERGCAFIDIAVCVAGLAAYESIGPGGTKAQHPFIIPAV